MIHSSDIYFSSFDTLNIYFLSTPKVAPMYLSDLFVTYSYAISVYQQAVMLVLGYYSTLSGHRRLPLDYRIFYLNSEEKPSLDEGDIVLLDVLSTFQSTRPLRDCVSIYSILGNPKSSIGIDLLTELLGTSLKASMLGLGDEE